MKRIILSIALIVVSFTVNSQTWLWGSQGTSKDTLWGGEFGSITTDLNGNAIYAADIFPGDTFQFGKDTVYTPYSSLCILKYDQSGNVMWLDNFKAITNNSGIGASVYGWPTMSTDKAGAIYMTGIFVDTAILGTSILIDKATQSSFTVKLDSKGNVKWARQSVQPSKACISCPGSIIADGFGNEYMAGSYNDTITFGGTTIISEGYSGMYIVKYDSAGGQKWVKSIGGKNRYGGTLSGIGTDKSGNIYVTGLFSNIAVFGHDTIRSIYRGMFTAKYDSAGNVKWVRQSEIPSMASDFFNVSGMTVDGEGNSYVIGNFLDTVIFGRDSLMTNNYYWGGLFIVKYNAQGAVVWAKQSKNNDYAGWGFSSIEHDSIGHIYVCAYNGAKLSAVEFCGDTIRTGLTEPGNDGYSFVQKIDTSGISLCSSVINGGGDDGNAFASDITGNYLYFGGDLATVAVFGPDTIGPKKFTETPNIARWQPCGVISIAPTINYVQESVTVYPNPTSGVVNFVIANEVRQSQLEVYNMLGEKVYSMDNEQWSVHSSSLSTANSQLSIDLSSQPAGIYLYRITDNAGKPIASGKLIINK